MTVAEPVRRTRASVVTPADFSPAERDRAYAIMTEHFVGVDRETFEHDLSEKDWVVRIDAADGLQGFTTLKLMTHDDGGTRVQGFFSGDTVLASEFMSESSWISVWSKHVFATAASRPDVRSYWVLLTATHRTYRILTGAFRRFYPDPNMPPDPAMRRILDAFVRQKFPDEYDAERGVVALKTPIPYRHADDVEAAAGEHHESSRFFRTINPGYLRGDFLCCLTEIHPSNLSPLGLRINRA